MRDVMGDAVKAVEEALKGEPVWDGLHVLKIGEKEEERVNGVYFTGEVGGWFVMVFNFDVEGGEVDGHARNDTTTVRLFRYQALKLLRQAQKNYEGKKEFPQFNVPT